MPKYFNYKCSKRYTPECTKWLCDTNNCKNYDPIIKTNQPEPTTAEMQEWLGKNFSVALEHRNGQKDRLEIAHGFWNFIAEENGFEKCVRTAYEWAKKQEGQNAKN